MSKKITKEAKELKDIYVHGEPRPRTDIKIDEVQNLYHKPPKIEPERNMTYQVQSDPAVMAHYFVQKYARKDILWVAEAPIQNILGDGWYWNWNNWAVRTFHMRVMNFQMHFNYANVWYGKIIKENQEFAELMFVEELAQVDQITIDQIKQMNKSDFMAQKEEAERRIKEQKEGNPVPSK